MDRICGVQDLHFDRNEKRLSRGMKFLYGSVLGLLVLSRGRVVGSTSGGVKWKTAGEKRAAIEKKIGPISYFRKRAPVKGLKGDISNQIWRRGSMSRGRS